MLDIRSVVSVAFFSLLDISISCKRDFFYQLCLIFDQLTFFRSVSLSVVIDRDFFDQDLSTNFSISSKRDFFDQFPFYDQLSG